MRKFICPVILFFMIHAVQAQTCDDVLRYVKSSGYGTTYSSFNSDAISKVTFYTITEDYEYRYYAIVCFKKEYFGCTEYIYQVGPRTKSNYSSSYIFSAGKAFWEFIQPYNKVLGCAPRLEE